MPVRIPRTAWTILLLLWAALALAACDGAGDDDDQTAGDGEEAAGLELAQEGRILVGSNLDFAPFEFIEGGEPTGFDIDLFDELAGRLGVEAEYQDASFDALITQLAAGEFDAIISAMTITEERRQEIDFTEPYFAANQGLVTTADSDIQGVGDLAGQAVGAQAGTTGLDYANENFTESQIVEFEAYPAAFTALEGGQIDAVLADLPVAAEQEQRSDAVQIVEEVETDELYGIGVPQDSTNLRDALDEALAEVVEDGTYEEIYSRWFEGDVPERFRR